MLRMIQIRDLWLRGYRTRNICSNVAAAVSGYLSFNGKFDWSGVMGAVYSYGYDFHLDMDLKPYIERCVDLSTPSRIEEFEKEWDSYTYEAHKHNTINSDTQKNYTFAYPSYEGCWTCSSDRLSRLMLNIDDGAVNIIKLSGVDPRVDQVAAMVAAATARTGNYDRRRRKYPFKISKYSNYAQTYNLKIYKKVGDKYHLNFETKKLHISSADKVNTIPSIWKGDLIEIFKSMGFDIPTRKKETNTLLRNMGIKFDVPPKRKDLIVDDVDFDPNEK
jgi:hypothetical protein